MEYTSDHIPSSQTGCSFGGLLKHPLRKTIVHVGKPIISKFRDLTDYEKIIYRNYSYYKFEEFDSNKKGSDGVFWTEDRFNKVHHGCARETELSGDIVVKIAINPLRYKTLYCQHCKDYFLIGKFGEFVWKDDLERVGV